MDLEWTGIKFWLHHLLAPWLSRGLLTLTQSFRFLGHKWRNIITPFCISKNLWKGGGMCIAGKKCGKGRALECSIFWELQVSTFLILSNIILPPPRGKRKSYFGIVELQHMKICWILLARLGCNFLLKLI